MSKRGWSSRVILRYALFQIPSYILLILCILIARHFIYIPIWIIVFIIAIWFTKDVLIFPSVWRAYDRSSQGNVQSIIGMRGTVEQKLNPSGYVKVNGALWQAELIEGAPPINEGEKIKVQGIRGITLIVEPIKKINLE